MFVHTSSFEPLQKLNGCNLCYSKAFVVFPDGYTSPNELLSYIRKNLADFKKDGGSNLEPYTESEGKIYQPLSQGLQTLNNERHSLAASPTQHTLFSGL